MTSKTPPSLAKPIPKTNTAAAALAFAEGGAAQQPKSEPPAPKPETVRLNAISGARRIADESHIVSELVTSGAVRVVAAVYDIASGEVEFIEDI